MINFKKNIYKPVKRTKKRVVRAFESLSDKVFFRQHLQNNTPVLVYQMGKVGSTSVGQSLKRYYSGVVLQAHYLSSNHKDWRVGRLYNWIMDGAKPVNVISLTREPIGRCVSGFFQNFERHTGIPYHKANFSIEELKAIFLKRFAHGHILQWFDNNIKSNFGIDVYSNSFPKCGYAIYNRNNIRLLVMHSELNDSEKVKIIKNSLELDEFQLTNKNISAQKEYGSTYNDFKKNVKLPLDFIEMMCNSKYFNYFYEQDVIDEVKKKWSEN